VGVACAGTQTVVLYGARPDVAAIIFGKGEKTMKRSVGVTLLLVCLGGSVQAQSVKGQHITEVVRHTVPLDRYAPISISNRPDGGKIYMWRYPVDPVKTKMVVLTMTVDAQGFVTKYKVKLEKPKKGD